MSAPRWHEPRVAGTLVRPRIPAGLFEAIARRVETRGLRSGGPLGGGEYRVLEVVDTSVARRYRDGGAGDGRGIHVVATSVLRGRSALNDVRIWQEGPHTLRYEVEFRELVRTRLVVFFAVAAPGIIAAFWLVVLRTAPLVGLAKVLPLSWLAVGAILLGEIALQVHSARGKIAHALDEEIDNAEEREQALRVPGEGPPASSDAACAEEEEAEAVAEVMHGKAPGP